MNLSESYKKRLKELAGMTIQENFYHGSAHIFDKFDISKVGTGDSNSKFGWGLYFTTSPDTAVKFAKDLTIGNLKQNGFNVYEVKLIGLDYFVQWDRQISDELFEKVYASLTKIGKSDDANQLREEIEEYELWTFSSLYEWLEVVMEGKKEASEFLYEFCHVNGTIAQSAFFSGDIYVAFSDDIVKIINHQKANDVYTDDEEYLEEEVLDEGYEDVQELKNLTNDIIRQISEKSINKIKQVKNEDEIQFFPVRLDSIKNDGKYKKLAQFLKEKNLPVFISSNKRARRGQKAYYKTYFFDNLPYFPDLDFHIEAYIDFKSLFDAINSIRSEGREFNEHDLTSFLFYEIHSNLLHELQHAYDDYRSQGKAFQSKKAINYNKKYDTVNGTVYNDLEQVKDYFNLPHEIWARFSQAVVKVGFFSVKTDNGQLVFTIKPINTVLDAFKTHFDLSKIDDNMKKKVISKLVQFWHFEQEKTAEKNKKLNQEVVAKDINEIRNIIRKVLFEKMKK